MRLSHGNNYFLLRNSVALDVYMVLCSTETKNLRKTLVFLQYSSVAFPMLGFNSTLCTEMHQSAFQIPVQSLQIRPLKWSQGMYNVHSYFLLSSYSLGVKATNLQR